MIRPSSSRITTTKSIITATMLLYSPAPHIEDSVQSSLEHHYRQRLLCQHLEQCYTQSLEPLTTRGRPAATNSAESESQDPIADSQASSIGDSGERTSILTLSQRLEGILSSTAHAGSLWGVSLADDSAERDSLLAAFLRAREWDVESADAFLRDTLAWRREQGFEGSSGSSGSSSSDGGAAPADVAAARLDFPDDTIRTLQGTELDEHSGKHTHTVVTHTVVVIRMGLITLEGLRAVEELVQWRVRMQEVSATAILPTDHAPSVTIDRHGVRLVCARQAAHHHGPLPWSPAACE